MAIRAPCCSAGAGLQARGEQLLETAVGLLQQLPVLAEILPAGDGHSSRRQQPLRP